MTTKINSVSEGGCFGGSRVIFQLLLLRSGAVTTGKRGAARNGGQRIEGALVSAEDALRMKMVGRAGPAPAYLVTSMIRTFTGELW